MSGMVSTLRVGALDLQMNDAAGDTAVHIVMPALEWSTRWKSCFSCTNKACHKKTNAHRNPMKKLLDFKIVTCKRCKSGVRRTVYRAEVLLPKSSSEGAPSCWHTQQGPLERAHLPEIWLQEQWQSPVS